MKRIGRISSRSVEIPRSLRHQRTAFADARGESRFLRARNDDSGSEVATIMTPSLPTTKLLAILLQLALLALALPAQDVDYTFHAQTELVLVNVTVRDKNGNFVRNLKPEDFAVKEDGKAQNVISFDLENTDAVATAEVAQTKLLG